MPHANVPVLLVEDDPFPRILHVILDPDTSRERCAAFAHLVAHELPDFEGWCKRARENARGLYPAAVRLVASQEELRANLRDASAAVVESLRIGREELDIARQLKVVQKYGTITRNIDAAGFGMRVAYYQRNRLTAAEEQQSHAHGLRDFNDLIAGGSCACHTY